MMNLQSTRSKPILTVSLAALFLTSCAMTPMGPTVQVMPGPGKTFQEFASDQTDCKAFAADQVKGQADASNQRAVGAAVVATLFGAGAGAAVGGGFGAAGQGAGIGAASGSLIGADIGAQQSSIDQMSIQQQYDNGFSQCMFAKGEQVPGFSPLVASSSVSHVSSVSSGPDPALVRGTQAELIRLNYLNGSADGGMGPRTSAAIRAYQQANGLSATGTVSQTLLARLQSTPSSAGNGGSNASATASAASPNWVAPTTHGKSPDVVPAAASPAPMTGGANGWVAPKTP